LVKRETIHSPDGSYCLEVEVAGPGEANVFRSGERIFKIQWDPGGWPASTTGHSTEESYGGFTIMPRGKPKYFIEKTFDTLKIILTLIRYGRLDWDEDD
jgi:hypothetical protein